MNDRQQDAFGPWSPGLNSTIPERLMPRVTLFAPEHALVPWGDARELSRLTGLAPESFAQPSPIRLLQHRCLIRVTAELHVPDGPQYADLGINMRAMVSSIFTKFLRPLAADIEQDLDVMKEDARVLIKGALDEFIPSQAEEAPDTRGVLARMLGKKPAQTNVAPPDQMAVLASLEERSSQSEDLVQNCLDAVAKIAGGVLSRNGVIRSGDLSWMATAAEILAQTASADAIVANAMDPAFDAGVKRLRYRVLPSQKKPVVLNAKGASAAGKSSIRGDQKQIAERLGHDWRDFAIISPDYWRKYLLDYDSLGDDYKYAAMLTGRELELIDKKLDIHMAQLGARGKIPHLLIDRFRFDSFQTAGQRAVDTRLLTRFGNRVYLFFLVTPPQDTVERAWQRGLETGRYKAVDDLLYHNIEAYSGMPDLFFSWAGLKDRWIHFEFLDNSVPQGETPRSIAFGQNGHLVIADLETFCDIERFRHVNVDANEPKEIFTRELENVEAMSLVRRACRELPAVDILSIDGIHPCASSRDGALSICKGSLPKGYAPQDFGEDPILVDELPALDPMLWSENIGSATDGNAP